MRGKVNKRIGYQAVHSQHAQRVVNGVADDKVAPVAAATHKGATGATATSTHAVHDQRGNDGRPAAWVAQDGIGRQFGQGAPVPEEFRQHRDQMVVGIQGGL